MYETYNDIQSTTINLQHVVLPSPRDVSLEHPCPIHKRRGKGLRCFRGEVRKGRTRNFLGGLSISSRRLSGHTVKREQTIRKLLSEQHAAAMIPSQGCVRIVLVSYVLHGHLGYDLRRWFGTCIRILDFKDGTCGDCLRGLPCGSKGLQRTTTTASVYGIHIYLARRKTCD